VCETTINNTLKKNKTTKKCTKSRQRKGQTLKVEPHVPSGVAKLSPRTRDDAERPTSLKRFVFFLKKRGVATNLFYGVIGHRNKVNHFK